MKTNKVTVRWFDGYMEEFETTETRFGCLCAYPVARTGKYPCDK